MLETIDRKNNMFHHISKTNNITAQKQRQQNIVVVYEIDFREAHLTTLNLKLSMLRWVTRNTISV